MSNRAVVNQKLFEDEDNAEDNGSGDGIGDGDGDIFNDVDPVCISCYLYHTFFNNLLFVFSLTE